jgi:hypothetical protein
MNFEKMLPLLGFVLTAITLVIVFKPLLGIFTTIFGAVFALGALSFLGWFILDYTH